MVSKLLKKEIFRQAVEDDSLGQGQMAEEGPAQLASLQAWRMMAKVHNDQQVHKLNLCL